MRFTGWWEESFDGLFNAGVLCVSPVDFESDEGHPLVGQWNSKEELISAAKQLGIDPEEIDIDE